MPQLRDGTIVEDTRLDRIEEFDERSREYPVMARLGAAPQQPITKQWPVNVWLNQGQEGACIGFGYSHEAAAEPVPVAGLTNTYARETVYWATQRDDPWPGGAYPGAQPRYEGTSVLTGAKTMVKLGFYTGYHWAFAEPEVALAISYLGPVVLGLPWFEGMYRPDTKGYLRPTGKNVGGHCILAVGYNAEQHYYTLHNSWGRNWGDNGTAKVSASSLAWLLAQRGEACIPDGRKPVTIA